LDGYRATVVSLQPSPSDETDAVTGVHFVSLGLQSHAPQSFLTWLRENPHDFVITNSVHQIETAFPYFPLETRHIVQLHDTSSRVVDVAVRNWQCLDGVACVANHIADTVRKRLSQLKFSGLVETVHNGAAFPPESAHRLQSGPIRLLFMGSMDPFKGIFDLVPILQRIKKLGVPVKLTIAGGSHDLLARQFKSAQLDSVVTWTGWVPHEECYRLAGESDVLLMTSRKEAFGMVTIEAMAMGCVPLAYDIVSGSREIIENGRNGFLLPLGDFAAWGATIKNLHENRAELRRHSESAMERARTHFNDSIMTARLCSFLESVRANAQTNKSERIAGIPLEIQTQASTIGAHYQRVPLGLRQWVRNSIGRSPRLSHWLLNRW